MLMVPPFGADDVPTVTYDYFMDGAESGLEGLLSFVFRRSTNAMVLADEQRRFVDANDAALRLLGCEREDLIGTPVADTIRPSERERAAREWQAFMRSGEHAGTRNIVRADGSEVRIEVAARFLRVGGRRLAVSVTLATSDPHAPPTPASARRGALTGREREVVTMIALGHDTSRIADGLLVSPETVRTHVRNAMSKLGARTRAQLVAIALSTGEAALLVSGAPATRPPLLASAEAQGRGG
jgi:PAS domain S-box-containing protein